MGKWSEAVKVRARIKRAVNQLPEGEARKVLESFAHFKRGGGENAKAMCRSLSGGFWSQSLDFHMRLCLGAKMRQDEGTKI
jgi:hypothetical protein